MSEGPTPAIDVGGAVGGEMLDESTLGTVSSIYYLLLVVAAVATALSVAVGYYQYKLSNIELEKMRLAVATANRDSALATVKAEEARSANIALSTRLANAIADAEAEKGKVLQMQMDVAESRRKQAEAELQLEQLRIRLRARSLTAEQRKAFVGHLGPLAGFRIRVIRLGEKEASEFADQIMAALKEAGISTVVSDIGVQAPPLYGVIVSSKAPTAAASHFLNALKSAQIQFTVGTALTGNEPIELLVGLKPPPDL